MIKKFGFTKIYYTALILIFLNGFGFWYGFSNTEFYVKNGTTLTVVSLIFGVALPLVLFMKIKCPKCGCKFFWAWFNGSKDIDNSFNPFNSESCPKCGYK